MKPYGLGNKLKYNFVDNHPTEKGYVNWWENINAIIKNREKQKSKKEILEQLNEIIQR